MVPEISLAVRVFNSSGSQGTPRPLRSLRFTKSQKLNAEKAEGAE